MRRFSISTFRPPRSGAQRLCAGALLAVTVVATTPAAGAEQSGAARGAAPGAQVPAASPAPAPDDPAYFYLLGRHLEGAGKADQAAAAYKRAIELDPKSAELFAALAGLYAREGKPADALTQAEAALARDPGNVEAHSIVGGVYAEYGERKAAVRPGDDVSTYPARAIAAFEKALGDGSDLSLNYFLARLYLQTGAFAKAVPLLKRVVDSQPGLVEAAVLLSTAQESAGMPDAAVETLEVLLRQNPGSYRAQIRIAEIREQQEEWSAAADAYGKAQALNPRAPLSTRRAVALLSSGRAGEARTVVQQAMAAGGPESKEPVLLYLLAESQRVLKDLDAAHTTAQKLLAAHPDDVRALHVMSLILQDKGDVKGAEKSLRDLIARDPLDAGALNSLGYMFAERGERLDEAVTLLQRALKVDPGNPSYLDSLGWAYFQQGRLDLADGPITEAAVKLRGNAVVQEHLGDLRYKQGRLPEAAAAWERALAGDGQSIDRARIEKKLRDVKAKK
jgi:tetratricopeptide (TPR) repeat protein